MRARAGRGGSAELAAAHDDQATVGVDAAKAQAARLADA
jgi:hypothetical protein